VKRLQEGINQKLADGLKLTQIFSTSDFKYIAVMENGIGVSPSAKAKLDPELIKENATLNKTIDAQKHQLGLLENTIKDLQDKTSEAIASDTKNRQLIFEKDGEIDALKKENAKIQKKLDKLMKE